MDPRSLFDRRLRPTRWGFALGTLLILGWCLLAVGSLSVMGLRGARAAPPVMQGEQIDCWPEVAPCS